MTSFDTILSCCWGIEDAVKVLTKYSAVFCFRLGQSPILLPHPRRDRRLDVACEHG